jgi:hypothetical protein
LVWEAGGGSFLAIGGEVAHPFGEEVLGDGMAVVVGDVDPQGESEPVGDSPVRGDGLMDVVEPVDHGRVIAVGTGGAGPGRVCAEDLGDVALKFLLPLAVAAVPPPAVPDDDGDGGGD